MAPENTLEAFRRARELGADWVELDVRRTADNVLAVHHDAQLPDGRPLVELGADQLPSHVPLLISALEACAGMGVNIEIKNLPDDPDYDSEHFVSGSVAALVLSRDVDDPVLVSSFNIESVDRIRAVDETIDTAWLTFDMANPDQAIERTVAGGHVALHPHVAYVDEAFVRKTHARGLRVHTWTVDDPDRIRELVEIGVDGIVTNVPDVARRIIDQG
ncbi:MAG: glycerophosphodiester phosphodiesterase [Acidimicrobiia bacterium]|nr:glycerophosphodiester phosphodiesterase [Acidimicrobiia bacterium]